MDHGQLNKVKTSGDARSNSGYMRQLVLERYYAQVAQGVQRFTYPTSVRVQPANASPLYTDASETSDHLSSQSLVERLNSGRAKLESGFGVRVVLAAAHIPKPYFVLADFPEPADEAGAEAAAELFSTEGAASVLLSRLFLRLGIAEHLHRSFALKILPRKGFNEQISAVSRDMLGCELLLTAPASVFCFGMRAARQFEELTGVRLEGFGACPVVEWGSLAITPFVFPSPRELAAFPEWRAGVWEELQALGPAR